MKKLALFFIVIFLFGCSAMEYDGDQNSERISSWIIDEIFNKPLDSVFKKSKISSDGVSEIVNLELPEVEFFGYHHDSPCSKSTRGMMMAKLTRTPNPTNSNSYLVNIHFGRLLEYKDANGNCHAKDNLGNLIVWDGDNPLQYVQSGYLQTSFSLLEKKGFLCKAFKSSVIEKLLSHQLEGISLG